MFKGSIVALITPFRQGKLDEEALARLVEWHIEQGTHGIVPVGTTGESPTLTHDEHCRVVELVVKLVAGRIPVIAGAGSNNPVEAIEMLDYILRQNPVNMAAARMDWGLWGGTYAKWAASPRYRHLMPELAAEAGGGAGASLASLSPEARAERVATCLSDLVAGILRLPPDGVDPGKSLLAMGVDSLMAMELQAGIDRQLGLRIPTLELMKGVALRALAANIADRIGASAADAAAAPRTGSPQPASPPAAPAEPAIPVARDVGELLSRLDSLSPAEVEQALAEFALLEESK